MYEEAADFAAHEADVQACIDCLAAAGVAPLDRAASLVLDVGGGGGTHAGLLAPRVRRIYCTDLLNQHSHYQGEFLKLLAQKFERNGHELDLDRFDFLQADALRLPFRDGYFDASVSFNAFEHIPDPAVALAEMVRVTRPGGTIYVVFDPLWTADTGSHFAHYVPEPWAHLLMSPETFRARMQAAGAGAEELAEFPGAMNGRRKAYFDALFSSGLPRGCFVALQHDWSGATRPEHREHPNFAACRAQGYSEDELLLRGYRLILSKPAP